MFSLSIAFSLIEPLLDRVAVVTFITPIRRKSKRNLEGIASRLKRNRRVWSLFYIPDKISFAGAFCQS